MDIFNLSMIELQQYLQQKKISAVELVHEYINRIKRLDQQIGAFLTICEEHALAQAKASDQRRANRTVLSSLDGIPIAVKDNICTKGIRTTCGSKILENFEPVYNSHVIEEIAKNGGILLGKTNMDEFAMGSSCENSAFFPCYNPWNLEYSPGGSSGGSAAAVAGRMTPIALGSDTGGSVRQPASLCGIVGLKPTYGRISRFGLIAFASSLDQIGILGRSSSDIASLLQIISTDDPKDSTYHHHPIPDFSAQIGKLATKGLKIGIPEEYWQPIGTDPEIYQICQESQNVWKNLGAELVPLSLPYTSYAIPTYYLIATAEASSNLSRYDGVRYGTRTLPPDAEHKKGAMHQALDDLFSHSRSNGFGKEVKRRIILGTYSLSKGYYDAYYAKALQVRTLIRKEICKALEQVDIILTPTSPIPAFKIGEKISDPLAMYLCDIFTVTFSLSGHPAISVPTGLTKNGLPIGIQMVSKYFSEDSLLAYSSIYEKHSKSCGFPSI